MARIFTCDQRPEIHEVLDLLNKGGSAVPRQMGEKKFPGGCTFWVKGGNTLANDRIVWGVLKKPAVRKGVHKRKGGHDPGQAIDSFPASSQRCVPE